MTTLTDAEEALLTPFNALAFDTMRTKAAIVGKIPPCWLCCSNDARAEARQDAIWALRGATGRATLLEDEAEAMCRTAIPTATVAKWREAELFHKEMREQGNPRAFFAE